MSVLGDLRAMLDVEAVVTDAGLRSQDVESLYRSWWAGCLNGGGGGPRAAQRLCDWHSPELWDLLNVLPGGVARVSRGGTLGLVSPGEWLAMYAGRVRIWRRARWVDGDFLWAGSRRPRSAVSTRWSARLYVPGSLSDDPSDRLSAVCAALESEGLWFEAKTWLSGRDRRDQTVIWISAADVAIAVDVVGGGLARETADTATTPPLTLPVWDGRIGIAHDPLPAGSLGMRICGAIVTAVDLDRASGGARGWRRACRYYDLTADKPWRHPGAVDPYGMWNQLEARWLSRT
jgi:hypothetical protein